MRQGHTPTGAQPRVVESDAPAGPSARKQFRQRRKTPNLRPNPKMCAEVRAKYMEPIIPPCMCQAPLGPMSAMEFGFVSAENMEGYAAHCETGVPWFASQALFLLQLAPPAPGDPMYLKHIQRSRKRADVIGLIDRAQLRAKYADIARRYLAGEFRGFHS